MRADGWEAGGGRYGAVAEDDSDVQAAGWQEESHLKACSVKSLTWSVEFGSCKPWSLC